MNIAFVRQEWGGEAFSMPVLALKLSQLPQRRFQKSTVMFPGICGSSSGRIRPWMKSRFRHITNGVHTGTWLARRYAFYFSTAIGGSDWKEHIDEKELWQRIDEIPDEDIWRIRQHLKRKLVAYMVSRARTQWKTTVVHPVDCGQRRAGSIRALTIGFARRFATYKRANLLFRDVDRLLRIVCNERKPVQIIFAGKAATLR